MKRILALDGGGIRGLFSLQVLARIEELFRESRKNPDLVLADIFDFIAGTSTGAIIAAFLSWGMPVRDIERLYVTSGARIFARERWYRRWKTKYRADPIADFFRETFSEENNTPALLGSKRLRTLLLVIMRNASTGSPWPLSNNPNAKYSSDPSRPDCNLNIPIWQLLRASTAAPYFFPPEQIALGKHRFLFLDGGMTPFNNPALIAVLSATLPAYKICWPASRADLHVVSIGTGSVRARLPEKIASSINLLDQIKYVAPALLSSVATEQDMLCRIMGDCLYANELDSEIGSLDSPSLFAPQEQKFSYVRYDQPLDFPILDEKQLLNVPFELDNLELIPLLQERGRAYASQTVRLAHLFPRQALSPTSFSASV